MNAKDWKRRGQAAGVVELPLPSGMVIKARRPNPLQYAEWNRLPLMLAAAAENGPAAVSAEQAQEIAGFMRELVVYCCVEPRVSETAAADSEDEIQPKDLPEEDWTFIVGWAMRLREAKALSTFRGKRTNDGAGSDGEAVFVQAVDVDGDRGSGAGAGVRPVGDGTGAGVVAGS